MTICHQLDRGKPRWTRRQCYILAHRRRNEWRGWQMESRVFVFSGNPNRRMLLGSFLATFCPLLPAFSAAESLWLEALAPPRKQTALVCSYGRGLESESYRIPSSAGSEAMCTEVVAAVGLRQVFVGVARAEIVQRVAVVLVLTYLISILLLSASGV